MKKNRNSKNAKFVEKVAHIQVNAASRISSSERDSARDDREKADRVDGAMYDVETGHVEFLEETFMLGEIKHFFLDVNGESPRPGAGIDMKSGVCAEVRLGGSLLRLSGST